MLKHLGCNIFGESGNLAEVNISRPHRSVIDSKSFVDTLGPFYPHPDVFGKIPVLPLYHRRRKEPRNISTYACPVWQLDKSAMFQASACLDW